MSLGRLSLKVLHLGVGSFPGLLLLTGAGVHTHQRAQRHSFLLSWPALGPLSKSLAAPCKAWRTFVLHAGWPEHHQPPCRVPESWRTCSHLCCQLPDYRMCLSPQLLSRVWVTAADGHPPQGPLILRRPTSARVPHMGSGHAACLSESPTSLSVGTLLSSGICTLILLVVPCALLG